MPTHFLGQITNFQKSRKKGWEKSIRKNIRSPRRESNREPHRQDTRAHGERPDQSTTAPGDRAFQKYRYIYIS